MTTSIDVSLAKNVVPQWSFALPTNGSDANLLYCDRGDSDVTSHGLTRR